MNTWYAREDDRKRVRRAVTIGYIETRTYYVAYMAGDTLHPKRGDVYPGLTGLLIPRVRAWRYGQRNAGDIELIVEFICPERYGT